MKNLDVEKVFPCQIKELKLSCWGCCGRNFKSKKEVEKDIEINTYEFSFLEEYDEEELIRFRERLSDNRWDLTPSGICSNLVDFGGGCFACPLHPKISEIVPKSKYVGPKKDLRVGHCDVNFECETLILWKQLSLKQKKEYILWLKERLPIDHYSYSLKNVEGILIREFLDEKYENF